MHGVDPSALRLAIKEAPKNTLEAVAREWYAKHAPRWVPLHAARVRGRLERDVFPWLGARPIGEVTPLDLLPCMRRIEARGAEDTAHRILQNLSAVFRYAVATGRCPHDITADLRGALAPVRKEHFPAVTEPETVGALLRALWGYRGTFVVQCALRLGPYLFVRPGELRHAEWCEFDRDASTWNLPAPKMRMREAHLVPLSRQAVGILRELYPLTGHGCYVFPSARSDHRPMSDNACLAAMRHSGIPKEQMVAHGWRATARTLLHEVLGFAPEVIEAQLAHKPAGALGSAYNRTKFLEERKGMMQAWADYLDRLRG